MPSSIQNNHEQSAMTQSRVHWTHPHRGDQLGCTLMWQSESTKNNQSRQKHGKDTVTNKVNIKGPSEPGTSNGNYPVDKQARTHEHSQIGLVNKQIGNWQSIKLVENENIKYKKTNCSKKVATFQEGTTAFKHLNTDPLRLRKSFCCPNGFKHHLERGNEICNSKTHDDANIRHKVSVLVLLLNIE